MSGDPLKLKAVKRIKRDGTLYCLTRVPNSGRVYFGGSDFSAYTADLNAKEVEPKTLQRHDSYVNGLAKIDNVLLTGGWDRKLIWWDTKAGKVIRLTDNAHAKWIRDVAACPDGSCFATVADDMFLRLWDPKTGKLLKEMRGHEPLTPQHFPSMLYVCTFSPDGKHIATGDRVGHIVIWDVTTGKAAQTNESPENYTWDPKQRRRSIGGVRSLAFSPDGKQLAVGGVARINNVDGLGGKALIHIYDWKTGKQIHRYAHNKRKGLVEHLAYSHDGKWLLGAGGDKGGFLLFANPADGKFQAEHDAKMHVHKFALDEASETIYAAGHGGLAVWSLAGGTKPPVEARKPDRAK
ncbi:MAG: WD40 repeat domain-containing protein [Planctomycetaceae bacterium]